LTVIQFPGIVAGKTQSITRTVTVQDTYGSPVPDSLDGQLLSSPGLIEMMIDASAQLINPLLPDGFTSVGKAASIIHEHPSVVGATVDLSVTISEFDGYHVSLTMEARDESGLIGTGTHVRSIVNTHWLQIRIHRRLSNE